MPIDALIKELIATGAMNEETLADLQRLLADFDAGRLDPGDEAYLRALHARLTGAPPPEPEEPIPVARIDGHSIEDWRDRALRAEAEVEALREQLAGEGPV